MIEISPDGVPSRDFGEAYSKSGKLLGRLIMPITTRLRSHYAMKGMGNTGSHLDIGCGDCLFLLRSPCERRVGLDTRYDDHVVDRLDFPDSSFDNVTMLAVIEHMENPVAIVREVHRVLRPGGRFVVTTPRRAAEQFIRLYSKDIDADEGGHEDNLDEAKMNELTAGLMRPVMYRTFLFGLNQLFVYEREEGESASGG